jgi:membrane protease YdiL (CAAX protease family)
MELYVLALAGIAVHFLLLLKQAMKKNNFVWQYFISSNLIQFGLSVIISGVLVYQYYSAPDKATETLVRVLGQWAWCIQFIAFAIGFMAGDILYRFEKSFSSTLDKVFPKRNK